MGSTDTTDTTTFRPTGTHAEYRLDDVMRSADIESAFEESDGVEIRFTHRKSSETFTAWGDNLDEAVGKAMVYIRDIDARESLREDGLDEETIERLLGERAKVDDATRALNDAWTRGYEAGVAETTLIADNKADVARRVVEVVKPVEAVAAEPFAGSGAYLALVIPVRDGRA